MKLCPEAPRREVNHVHALGCISSFVLFLFLLLTLVNVQVYDKVCVRRQRDGKVEREEDAKGCCVKEKRWRKS